jgi:hypothetical protein
VSIPSAYRVAAGDTQVGEPIGDVGRLRDMTTERDTGGATTTDGRRTPPELPKSLVDLLPPVIIGTVLWAIALAASLLLQYVGGVDVGLWPQTALAGVALGFIGMGIVSWQRRASRRGSRGAQRGL